MIYEGVIVETRDHPSHPLKIALDMGDKPLDVGWVMVMVGAWAAVKRSDLVAGVLCVVFDNGRTGDPNKYKVLDFAPSKTLILPDNRRGLVRGKAAVAISGKVNLRPEAMAAAATNPLTGFPLGHDLTGEVIE